MLEHPGNSHKPNWQDEGMLWSCCGAAWEKHQHSCLATELPTLLAAKHPGLTLLLTSLKQ